MMDARTVAMVARAVSEDEATALIEQYGCWVASVAAVKSAEKACNRCLLAVERAINAPLVQR